MGKLANDRVTLWEVVKTVQDTAGSDCETVAVLAHLFETRRVLYPRPETH